MILMGLTVLVRIGRQQITRARLGQAATPAGGAFLLRQALPLSSDSRPPVAPANAHGSLPRRVG